MQFFYSYLFVPLKTAALLINISLSMCNSNMCIRSPRYGLIFVWVTVCERARELTDRLTISRKNASSK